MSESPIKPKLSALASRWLRAAVTDEDTELPFYAWPGGYPIYYLNGWNEPLCPQCATEIVQTYDPEDTDPKDQPIELLIHWEGPVIFCDCGREIEAAYGDPWSEEEEDTGE